MATSPGEARLAKGHIAGDAIAGFVTTGHDNVKNALDDLTAINEQLDALAAAGVPLDIALGHPDQPIASALERIQTIVTRRVNRGETLEEALEGDDQDVPASYRSLLQMRLRTGTLADGLDGSSRVAGSLDDSRFVLGSAFVYPLILCALAYLGLIGFCVYLVPVWQGMYEGVRLTPGPALRILQTVRNTLPYWVAIPPVIGLSAVAAWLSSSSRPNPIAAQDGGHIDWLPGAKRTLFQKRCAHFADMLGKLLDAGTPLDEALRIAGDGSNDADLRAGAHLLAEDVKCGALPSDSGRTASLFPPFLRWALWHADETTGRARALEIAARLYQDAADRRTERFRALAPIAAVLLIGGTVTLLYGLALFVPFVELIRSLSS